MTPRGDVPDLYVDVTHLEGPANSTGTVEKRRDGRTDELWYEPLPVWMTETPVVWANGDADLPVVEVYRTTAAGDKVKAVCDGAPIGDASFAGKFKGREQDCEFVYSSDATPVVFNYTILSYIDHETSEIAVDGDQFLMDGENSTVSVSIANQPCNITSITNHHLVCEVRSVPWGDHVVNMAVGGYGNALRLTQQLLDFRMKIYTVTPLAGSFAGGQLMALTGRGFRSNATILIGSTECDIVWWSSSSMTCRTPAIEASALCSDANCTGIMTASPTVAPTTVSPTYTPTAWPSLEPTPSPTIIPTSGHPSSMPSSAPSVPTGAPSSSPSIPSGEPSGAPSPDINSSNFTSNRCSSSVGSCLSKW